jgi:hypothetical protein
MQAFQVCTKYTSKAVTKDIRIRDSGKKQNEVATGLSQ